MAPWRPLPLGAGTIWNVILAREKRPSHAHVVILYHLRRSYPMTVVPARGFRIARLFLHFDRKIPHSYRLAGLRRDPGDWAYFWPSFHRTRETPLLGRESCAPSHGRDVQFIHCPCHRLSEWASHCNPHSPPWTSRNRFP